MIRYPALPAEARMGRILIRVTAAFGLLLGCLATSPASAQRLGQPPEPPAEHAPQATPLGQPPEPRVGPPTRQPPEPKTDEPQQGTKSSQPGQPPEPSDALSVSNLPSEIRFREFLTISAVGQVGRLPLHADPIDAAMANGSWHPPEAGDALTSFDDRVRQWRVEEVDDEGWLSARRLRGGYALFSVQSAAERTMILDGTGFATVFVNGEPRGGDPYGFRSSSIPVRLRRGRNDFLFQIGARLRARLKVPQAEVWLLDEDGVWPDIVSGETEALWASVVAVNASSQTVRDLQMTVRGSDGAILQTAVASLPPFSFRPVAFQIPVSADGDPLNVELSQLDNGQVRVLHTITRTLRTREANQTHLRTFRSSVDGSVQAYALRKVEAPENGELPGLLVALHGAAVTPEATVEAASDVGWAHVVAPGGRGAFGFDWENWSRLDVQEVLEQLQPLLEFDPQRVCLTGRAMGGHGSWHLGVTHADQFAAVAPETAWISFRRRSGLPDPEEQRSTVSMLMRAASPSDTMQLLPNLSSAGIFLFHARNHPATPVTEARFLRSRLAEFHENFAYFEDREPISVDRAAAPPLRLLEFLRLQRSRPAKDVQKVDFITMNPAIESRSHWATVHAQMEMLRPSRVQLELHLDTRKIEGTTTNVQRLALDVSQLAPNKQLEVELDGSKIENIPWPADTQRVWLRRTGRSHWQVSGRPVSRDKGPQRYGPFKQAFGQHALLVYGTEGSPAENAWALAKARYDAETFWYRGRGALEIVSDRDFLTRTDADRSIVLYGNANTNAAWPKLLSTSPIQVRKGVVRVAGRPELGDDIGCLMVRPRPDSDRALVAVVGGTGLAGMRATNRLRYFMSGVAYPDVMLFDRQALQDGLASVRLAGFFGLDWRYETGEFEWRDLAL